MAIARAKEPKRGRRLAHTALRKRIRRDHPLASLRDGLEAGAAIPVYRVSEQFALDAEPLSRARRVGWKYPFMSGENVGLLFLSERRQHLKLRNIVEGPLARSVFAAATLADKELGTLDTAFQPRLFEIPSLHVSLLWLYASRGRSRFIPLIEGPTVPTPKIQDDSDVRLYLQTVGRNRRTAAST